jgi:hypothetical protein
MESTAALCNFVSFQFTQTLRGHQLLLKPQLLISVPNSNDEKQINKLLRAHMDKAPWAFAMTFRNAMGSALDEKEFNFVVQEWRQRWGQRPVLKEHFEDVLGLELKAADDKLTGLVKSIKNNPDIGRDPTHWARFITAAFTQLREQFVKAEDARNRLLDGLAVAGAQDQIDQFVMAIQAVQNLVNERSRVMQQVQKLWFDFPTQFQIHRFLSVEDAKKFDQWFQTTLAGINELCASLPADVTTAFTARDGTVLATKLQTISDVSKHFLESKEAKAKTAMETAEREAKEAKKQYETKLRDVERDLFAAAQAMQFATTFGQVISDAREANAALSNARGMEDHIQALLQKYDVKKATGNVSPLSKAMQDTLNDRIKRLEEQLKTEQLKVEKLKAEAKETEKKHAADMEQCKEEKRQLQAANATFRALFDQIRLSVDQSQPAAAGADPDPDARELKEIREKLQAYKDLPITPFELKQALSGDDYAKIVANTLEQIRQLRSKFDTKVAALQGRLAGVSARRTPAAPPPGPGPGPGPAAAPVPDSKHALKMAALVANVLVKQYEDMATILQQQPRRPDAPNPRVEANPFRIFRHMPLAMGVLVANDGNLQERHNAFMQEYQQEMRAVLDSDPLTRQFLDAFEVELTAQVGAAKAVQEALSSDTSTPAATMAALSQALAGLIDFDRRHSKRIKDWATAWEQADKAARYRKVLGDALVLAQQREDATRQEAKAVAQLLSTEDTKEAKARLETISEASVPLNRAVSDGDDSEIQKTLEDVRQEVERARKDLVGQEMKEARRLQAKAREAELKAEQDSKEAKEARTRVETSLETWARYVEVFGQRVRAARETIAKAKKWTHDTSNEIKDHMPDLAWLLQKGNEELGDPIVAELADAESLAFTVSEMLFSAFKTMARSEDEIKDMVERARTRRPPIPPPAPGTDLAVWDDATFELREQLKANGRALKQVRFDLNLAFARQDKLKDKARKLNEVCNQLAALVISKKAQNTEEMRGMDWAARLQNEDPTFGTLALDVFKLDQDLAALDGMWLSDGAKEIVAKELKKENPSEDVLANQVLHSREVLERKIDHLKHLVEEFKWQLKLSEARVKADKPSSSRPDPAERRADSRAETLTQQLSKEKADRKEDANKASAELQKWQVRHTALESRVNHMREAYELLFTFLEARRIGYLKVDTTGQILGHSVSVNEEVADLGGEVKREAVPGGQHKEAMVGGKAPARPRRMPGPPVHPKPRKPKNRGDPEQEQKTREEKMQSADASSEPAATVEEMKAHLDVKPQTFNELLVELRERVDGLMREILAPFVTPKVLVQHIANRNERLQLRVARAEHDVQKRRDDLLGKVRKLELDIAKIDTKSLKAPAANKTDDPNHFESKVRRQLAKDLKTQRYLTLAPDDLAAEILALIKTAPAPGAETDTATLTDIAATARTALNKPRGDSATATALVSELAKEVKKNAEADEAIGDIRRALIAKVPTANQLSLLASSAKQIAELINKYIDVVAAGLTKDGLHFLSPQASSSSASQAKPVLFPYASVVAAFNGNMPRLDTPHFMLMDARVSYSAFARLVRFVRMLGGCLVGPLGGVQAVMMQTLLEVDTVLSMVREEESRMSQYNQQTVEAVLNALRLGPGTPQIVTEFDVRQMVAHRVHDYAMYVAMMAEDALSSANHAQNIHRVIQAAMTPAGVTCVEASWQVLKKSRGSPFANRSLWDLMGDESDSGASLHFAQMCAKNLQVISRVERFGVFARLTVLFGQCTDQPTAAERGRGQEPNHDRRASVSDCAPVLVGFAHQGAGSTHRHTVASLPLVDLPLCVHGILDRTWQ